MKAKSDHKIDERKIKQVKEIAEKIKESRSILIVDVKSIPSRQFQEIRKRLRGKADIKIARSSIIKRAIDKASVGAKALEEYVKEDTALFFSQLDPFELSAMLSENKTPVKAKAGDIAQSDIHIDAGPTELVPGPVISELGSLGLKIAVEDGKITIKESKVIVKTGEKISENASSFMNKMDIKPFSIGFTPLAAYDNQDKKVYTNIRIDKEAVLKEAKESHARAFAFAIKLAYPCQDTIKMLLGKASLEYNKLNSFVNKSQEEK